MAAFELGLLFVNISQIPDPCLPPHPKPPLHPSTYPTPHYPDCMTVLLNLDGSQIKPYILLLSSSVSYLLKWTLESKNLWC